MSGGGGCGYILEGGKLLSVYYHDTAKYINGSNKVRPNFYKTVIE